MDNTAELLALVKTRMTMHRPDSRITLEAAKRNDAKGTNRKIASSAGFYNPTPAVSLDGARCGGNGVI